MQTIMIVEDDPVIREELAFLLGNENYRALPVTDFETILEQVRSVCPNLVLLDLGLPKRDGLSLCAAHLPSRGKPFKNVRKININSIQPILLLC